MSDAKPPRIRVKRFDVREIENEVSALFARHPQASTIPVPIDLLVELEGAKLDVMRGIAAEFGVQGATLKDVANGQIWIYVDDRLADEDRALNRYRSTISEELGHLILHREVIERVNTYDDFRELQCHSDWPNIERNAKRFGACALMPASRVIRSAEELYPELVRIAGYGDAEAILKYLASRLASQFQVSPQSMTYRLTEWPIRVDARVRNGVESELDYLPS